MNEISSFLDKMGSAFEQSRSNLAEPYSDWLILKTMSTTFDSHSESITLLNTTLSSWQHYELDSHTRKNTDCWIVVGAWDLINKYVCYFLRKYFHSHNLMLVCCVSVFVITYYSTFFFSLLTPLLINCSTLCTLLFKYLRFA